MGAGRFSDCMVGVVRGKIDHVQRKTSNVRRSTGHVRRLIGYVRRKNMDVRSKVQKDLSGQLASDRLRQPPAQKTAASSRAAVQNQLFLQHIRQRAVIISNHTQSLIKVL